MTLVSQSFSLQVDFVSTYKVSTIRSMSKLGLSIDPYRSQRDIYTEMQSSMNDSVLITTTHKQF